MISRGFVRLNNTTNKPLLAEAAPHIEKLRLHVILTQMKR